MCMSCPTNLVSHRLMLILKNNTSRLLHIFTFYNCHRQIALTQMCSVVGRNVRKNHKDYNQVVLDVRRSMRRFPKGSFKKIINYLLLNVKDQLQRHCALMLRLHIRYPAPVDLCFMGNWQIRTLATFPIWLSCFFLSCFSKETILVAFSVWTLSLYWMHGASFLCFFFLPELEIKK